MLARLSSLTYGDNTEEIGEIARRVCRAIVQRVENRQHPLHIALQH
jgi:hypothetical protein